ncbi:TIR domain-containing protein [Zobellia roscoffensis]|uniref:TIR domain-containing protein n=1 Tax=Zobellia roscoffensis TaxID=2779508 RepID=UPI00188CB590|nr:TIR domain-containing protein [Zobellia roscoffensis]
MILTKNIFAIYAGQDRDVLQSLLLHLQSIQKDFNIAIWSDVAIDDRQRLEPQNVSRLDRTDVFLLLLSHTFMNSEFIKQDEFKIVIDQYKEGKATIIPILLDDCQWDVEFTFDHYNFNFRELQVFQKDTNAISDWNPTDRVFMQVAYYMMGLLSSSAKKRAIEDPVHTDEQKMLNVEREGQIAIDFFSETVVDNKAESERIYEDAEVKKSVEEENKLREETEAKEQIRKEKWLKEKAENQLRIEKEAEARRAVVQEEIREREFIKARIAIGQKRQEQVTESLREPAWEQGLGETVTTERISNRKNSLAKYNYRFNNKNTIEARSIVPERKRVIEEPKIQLVVEEEISEKIINPVRETQREKELEETVAVEETATRKTDLAKYNYRFDNKREIEVLKVEIEKSGKEEPKTQVAVGREKRRTLLKVLEETEWKKKLGERVASLKAVAKESISKCKHLLDVKIEAWGKKVAPEESSGKEELKTQIAVDRKKRPTVLKAFEATQWKKKFGERVISLKISAKESLSKYKYLLDSKLYAKAKRVVSEEKLDSEGDSKNQTTIKNRRGVAILKTLQEFEWDKKLHERFATFKRVTKNYSSTIQGFTVKSVVLVNQFLGKVKKNIISNKKRKVRSEILIGAVVVLGILTYLFVGGSEKQSFSVSEIEDVKEVSDASVSPESNKENRTGASLKQGDSEKQPASIDKNRDVKEVSDASVATKNNQENRAGAILKLSVGDMHNEGIIFTIDPSSNTGKIAYLEDMGPMAWKDAMNIHKQLGEGWRLPELDELRLLYKTIGQGADNKGKFVAELYWSATPFDKHQARLVKFSDGNASYHYNSSGTHRKFLVRAIKDVKL